MPDCTATLPNSGMVDAGFMLGPDSGFVPGAHNVVFHSVEVKTAQVEFEFHSDAPGLSGYRWLFVFPVDAKFGCTVHADATLISSGVPAADKGWGFMTVGDLDEILSMGEDFYGMCQPPRVEPALIQSLAQTYVRSLNIANQTRPCPAECCETPVPVDPEQVFVLVEGLDGDIRFREGNNLQISASAVRNSIELSADLGAGEGRTCEDLLVTGSGPAGIQEDDGSLCESCEDYVRSVNGVRTNDGKLILVGAAGVKVVSDGPNHKVTVRVEPDRICAPA